MTFINIIQIANTFASGINVTGAMWIIYEQKIYNSLLKNGHFKRA